MKSKKNNPKKTTKPSSIPLKNVVKDPSHTKYDQLVKMLNDLGL